VAGSGLDVPGLVIHSLRHTYASLSIAAGATVKTLQSAMGHKDATETLNIYADLWPEQLDEVSDALDNQRAKALHAAEEDTGIE
jgi:integrase